MVGFCPHGTHGFIEGDHLGIEIAHPGKFDLRILGFMFHFFVEVPEDARFHSGILEFWHNTGDLGPDPGNGCLFFYSRETGVY